MTGTVRVRILLLTDDPMTWALPLAVWKVSEQAPEPEQAKADEVSRDGEPRHTVVIPLTNS